MDTLPRYGVFLRPDPLTCAAVTAIATQLRAQYGLVSAATFPPHATLAGSLPIADPNRLIDNLTRALHDRPEFLVENGGLQWLGDSGGLIYDVSNVGEQINGELRALAEAVHTVIQPLLTHAPGLAADTYEPERWRAHLSLASHDLIARPDLRDEVWAYAHGLDVTPPARFQGDTIALYRFTSPSWTGEWWRAMEWEHLRSWHLAVRNQR